MAIASATFAAEVTTEQTTTTVNQNRPALAEAVQIKQTKTTVTQTAPATQLVQQRIYRARVVGGVRPGLAESEWAFAHPKQAMVRDMHRYAVPVPAKELY